MCKRTDERLRIGDVYLVEFHGIEHEQRGKRPALVIQNNKGNANSPNVIVLPMTSSGRKFTNQPTHVFIPASCSGLLRDSVVLCESPECISKSRLERYLTTLSNEYMEKIAVATLLSTSIISFIWDKGLLLSTWEQAELLNR